MKILLVANTLPPKDVSGVGEQVLQLASGLQARGHSVRVLGRGAQGARGPKLLFPLMVLPPFLRELERFRPDIVQVHESDGALAALATKVLSGVLEPRPRLVALLQVSYLEELRAIRPLRSGGRILGVPGWREWMFRFFKAPLQIVLGSLTAWLSDVVLAPSRQTALELERDYKVDTVCVVPNVTGGRRIANAVEPPVEEPAGYLLFVGRLRIRKGVEVLLHALAELRSRGRLVRLLVAGDGEHRAALEASVKRLDLQDSVRFIGSCDAGAIRYLMSRARALVVPSIYEGMPLVVLEAMDSGLPVVASAVSGLPEVIEPEKNGWLFPAEDVAALREILAEIEDDPEACRERGRLGRLAVDRFWRPERSAAIWCQLLGIDAGELRQGGDKP